MVALIRIIGAIRARVGRGMPPDRRGWPECHNKAALNGTILRGVK